MGVKWWQVDIKPEYAKIPVEAFGFGQIGKILTGAGIGVGAAISAPFISNILKERNQNSIFNAIKERIDDGDIDSALMAIDQLDKNKRLDKDIRNQLLDLIEQKNK